MTEALEVEAVFRKDKLEPRAFRWQGKLYQPLETGRHWQVEGQRHWLVRTMPGEVFELIYHLDQNHWSMGRTPADFQPGVRLV